MKKEIVYGRYGRPDRYWIDGREVGQLEFEAAREGPDHGGIAEMLAQGSPPANAQGTTTWPQRSESFGCLPKQVEAMNARNKKRGIATRYDQTGTAIIPTSRDRAALTKLESEVLKTPLVDKS